MSNKKILIAEDDPNFGLVLQSYLSINDFEVNLCPDGNRAFSAFKADDYDLCILDVMMPHKDGFSLAESIQSLGRNTPFIFLTARSLKEDKIKGYQLGAVDYLVKPFDPEILLLKIQAILKSNEVAKPVVAKEHHIGQFLFDPEKRRLALGEEQIKLSPKESDLLQLLCESNGEVLKREDALLKIWKEDSYFTTKSMDVYITKLRKFLRKDKTHKIEITNLHGKGFVLSVGNI